MVLRIATLGLVALLGLAGVALAERSTCTCYYGYDEECPGDFVCCGNFTGKDKCIRMKGPGKNRKEQKGGAWRKDGKGCTIKDGDGNGIIAACDGTCVEKTDKKKQCSSATTDQLVQVIGLWAAAMTDPGLAGGGPMDPALVAQARAVGLDPVCTEYLGWRTMGVMELCRGNDAILHLQEPHDALEDHWIADLSGQTCLIESGNKCIEAITVGLEDPSAVDPILDSILGVCGTDEHFGRTGLDELTILDGVKNRIGTTVEYLTPVATPQMPTQALSARP